MTGQAERARLEALGARILSEANDMKRTPEALARELGVEQRVVDAVISGAAGLEAARALVIAMTEAYPVSLADLWVEPDDTDHGVILMSAAQSYASRRVFERKGRNGSVSPYYEYRDTATSRSAPFRPEWITQLRVVDDADPHNADVAFNNGHLLHQATFFIGPVNFYWCRGGERRCAELDTGDSNYITPFVPHSFASRDRDRLGAIVAVTYAGEAKRARAELGSVGSAEVAELAGDLRSGEAFAQRLRRHLDAECLDEDALALRLAEAGVERARSEAILGGSAPGPSEIEMIAAALNVRPADLTVCRLEREEEVIVRRHAETGARGYPSGNAPAYRLRELARVRYQPLLKGFDVAVLDTQAGDMRHGLHEYLYNYGHSPVELVWDGARRETLGPGDSAYVRPMVRHRFARAGGEEPGRLVMIRVPGLLTDSVLDELARFDSGGRSRALHETGRWF